MLKDIATFSINTVTVHLAKLAAKNEGPVFATENFEQLDDISIGGCVGANKISARHQPNERS